MAMSPSPAPRSRRFRLTGRMILAYLCLIPVAIGIGFGSVAIYKAYEKHKYPQYAEDTVRVLCSRYGLPPSCVYAVMSRESGFSSSASENGRTGLMGLTRGQFSWIGENLLHESKDPGLLFDPDTNLRYGCAYLAYLYDRYLLWDTALAAYRCGTEQVDAWLEDETLTDSLGALWASKIPDAEIRNYVRDVLKVTEKYKELYP